MSGSTVTGDLTIGNFIGAINNWSKLQSQYDCYYMVADLHALTTPQDPKELHQRCLSFFAQYIACGLDHEKNTIFIQSQVPQHAELAWVLTCMTPFGQLGRMTQFKEKSEHRKEVQTGLFTYPCLMAADILLYQADLVPVGEDQKQHLELTRDLCQSFNKRFGQCFTLPEPFIAKQGARIMSLQDPTKKMSKSDEDPGGFVSIIDPPKKIQKKIKSAVTDSGSEVKFSEDKPGISNLLTIYSCLTDQSIESIEEEFQGKMYGHLKVALADLVCDRLAPVQERYNELMADPGELENLMARGAHRARLVAEETLHKAYLALGLPRRLGSFRP